ncbi:MAG: TolC family protein, partial [Desulfobulbia bacterium]
MSSAKTISGCIPFTFILLGLLTGCAVGPDFKRPATPDTPTYTATPLPAQTSSVPTPLGESQHFVAGGWVNPQWWQELGSPKLNALIDEALQASPTLAKSQAVLRQAQELYAAQAGSTLYPQVDATLGAQRQRTTPSSLGQIGEPREFSLYNAGVGVRYTLDLAGATRRTLEALAANIDYQRYQLEGARLTLTGNIATTTVTQARLAAQIQATEAILHSQEEQLGLTRERVRLGHAALDDVLALQTQVEQTRAGIPLLRNQLQQNDHLLAVLAGREPGAG